MLLRPGEVLQGRAERYCGDHAEIDLHASGQADGHFRVAAGQDLGQPAVMGQVIHHRVCILCLDQEIQIAHGILATAIGAGGFDCFDRPATVHVAEDRLDVLIGIGPEHATVGL